MLANASIQEAMRPSCVQSFVQIAPIRIKMLDRASCARGLHKRADAIKCATPLLRAYVASWILAFASMTLGRSSTGVHLAALAERGRRRSAPFPNVD
jgi:hypothetical protein